MMAEALGVLGGISTIAQIVEDIVKITAFTKELQTDIRNGSKLISEKINVIQEFIDTLTAIQLEQTLSEAVNPPHIASCLKDAISIRDTLETISTSSGNGHSKRLKMGIHWNTKKKEISRLCTELEGKKSTLAISMQKLLPSMHEFITTIHKGFPELLSKVSSIHDKINFVHEALQPGKEVQLLHFSLPVPRNESNHHPANSASRSSTYGYPSLVSVLFVWKGCLLLLAVKICLKAWRQN